MEFLFEIIEKMKEKKALREHRWKDRARNYSDSSCFVKLLKLRGKKALFVAEA